MLKVIKPSENGKTLVLNENQEQFEFLVSLGVTSLSIYSHELEKEITLKFDRDLADYVVIGLSDEDLDLLYQLGNGNYIFV